jgi:hypothetical protein
VDGWTSQKLTDMKKKKATLDGRKRSVKWLMEHRKVDVSDFADKVYGELRTWNDWDDQAEHKFDEWFQELRDNMDDLDCAIFDVLLAASVEDAESIAEGFRATCVTSTN